MSFLLLRGRSSTVTYHAKTTAWAAACSTPPSTTRKGIIDTMVVGIEADGNLATLDWLLIASGETENAGLVNIANATKVATNISATAFAADHGFTGDGVADYIDIGEHVDAGGNWTLNSAALGVWFTQAGGTGTKAQAGDGSSSDRVKIMARNNSGNEIFAVNDDTDSVFQGNPGTRSGHRSIGRTTSTNKQGYFNGTKIADVAVASVGLSTSNLFIIHAASVFGTDQFNAFWSGAGRSDAGHLAMYNRIGTALTAIGAI